MIDVNKKLQIDIKSVVDSMILLKEESSDIYKAYWSTDANTQVGGLASGDDAATESSKLTKTNYLNGITLCEDLEDFFGNEAVTTTDYLQNCEKIRYSDAGTPTKLSEATEGLGERIQQVAIDCIVLLQQCRNILQVYSANEVSDMITNLDPERPLGGCQLTASDMNSGITLVEQFKKMLSNEAVSTGDYASTLAKWVKY
jgi:hypothetical protein